METKRTSLFANGLVWFGAGLSIAEILTGTYFAPMGFKTGLAAIIIGHIIGCLMLFFAGVIGGQTRKGAMETAHMSFGKRGGAFFAILNILQLVGWTAIMIYDGALAAAGAVSSGTSISGNAAADAASISGSAGTLTGIFGSHAFWCLVIGALIILWIMIGLTNLGKINTVAMTALLILTGILCFKLAGSGSPLDADLGEAMSFGAAVELSVAMPLSWLPLISDYTREAERPVAATAVSAVVYGIVSCWMYIIGMAAAIFTGEFDIAAIMLKAGLGIAGLLIIVLSTVTTTFLDAYSAGVSSEAITGRVSGRHIAVAAAVIGTIGAVIFPMDDITGFLYLIGSVFAPMIAILFADYFILKQDHSATSFNWLNLGIWLIGFALYRFLMTTDLIVGCTLPDMVITVLICVAVHMVIRRKTA